MTLEQFGSFLFHWNRMTPVKYHNYQIVCLAEFWLFFGIQPKKIVSLVLVFDDF